jgi:hypothetical protein
LLESLKRDSVRYAQPVSHLSHFVPDREASIRASDYSPKGVVFASPGPVQYSEGAQKRASGAFVGRKRDGAEAGAAQNPSRDLCVAQKKSRLLRSGLFPNIRLGNPQEKGTGYQATCREKAKNEISYASYFLGFIHRLAKRFTSPYRTTI